MAGLGLLLLLVAIDLSVGDFPIPLGDVVRTLLGGGDAGQRFIVMELRLPQTWPRSPSVQHSAWPGRSPRPWPATRWRAPTSSGSPRGAAFAAVLVIVASGASGYGGGLVTGRLQELGLPLAAFTGAMVTAALLYLFSWRRGLDVQRLVLVGIGLGATLTAGTSLPAGQLADPGRRQRAGLAERLAHRPRVGARASGPADAGRPPSGGPAAGPVAQRHAARRRRRPRPGVRLQLTQVAVLVVAVGLASVSVAAVGPLEFVAFVVPQVALRLTRGSRPPVLASMVAGAILVVGADLVTRAVLPFALPAGIVTAAIGAPYLIWLLVRTNRRRTA